MKYTRLAFLILFLAACSSDDDATEVDCSAINISATITNDVCAQGNGAIDLSFSGGTAPYTVRVNSQDASQTVSNLTAGDYQIAVTDSKGCSSTRSFSVTNQDVTFTLSAENVQPTTCGDNNGSFDVSASGGDGSFTYSLDGTSFQSSNRFEGLSFGEKEVFVKDGGGCLGSFKVVIETGIDFAEIKAIVESNCALAACHDGTNSNPNFTVDGTIVSTAEQIASRSGNGSMPPGSATLDDVEIEKIACWASDLAAGS